MINIVINVDGESQPKNSIKNSLILSAFYSNYIPPDQQRYQSHNCGPSSSPEHYRLKESQLFKKYLLQH